MNIAALANTFVPIFAGQLLGYLAGLLKFADNQNVRTLITFVMSVELPCDPFSTVGRFYCAWPFNPQGEVAAVLGITYVLHWTHGAGAASPAPNSV
jgi:malonate transporter and related proteins